MAPSVDRPDVAGGSTSSNSGANTSTGSVGLDVDALKKSIREDIGKLVDYPGTVTISKVDKQTRAVADPEYTPHDVPIGPYHRGCCLPSQETKLRALRFVLYKVVPDGEADVVLRDLLEEMARLEGQARACYADRFGEMTREDFVQMLLFDGCYLLVFFVDNLEGREAAAAAQPSTGSAGVEMEEEREDESGVRDSFYLLENQIPFFVLERIYMRVTGRLSGDDLLKLITKRVQTLLRQRLYIGGGPAPDELPRPESPDHLLHLVHQQIQRFTLAKDAQPTQGNVTEATQDVDAVRTQQNGGTQSPSPESGGTQSPSPESSGTARPEAQPQAGSWHQATEYRGHANVRFERLVSDNSTQKYWSILDVSLHRGTLRMPRLSVDTNTWTILRNLMALEKLRCRDSNSKTAPRVTAYCMFMSQVACTAEDVELLCSAGVLEHLLGNYGEVADGFADLCKGVVLELDDTVSNYLKPTWQEMERRYWSRKHKLVALFRRRHCRDPYYIVAFIVAVILFASAVLQAVFAVLSYMHKR